MNRTTLLAAAFALLTAACGGRAPTAPSGITIQADLSEAAVASVAMVTVYVTPAEVHADLALDAATGRFSGTVQLPAGPQTLSVEAWADVDQDGLLDVVASGSADALIVEGQTASVLVRLIEAAPPPPAPDHAPLILSFGVANANPAAGVPVAVWASAWDADNDPISFTWSATCNVGTPSFGDPASPSTTFSVDEPATCELSVAASANGKVVNATMSLVVGSPGSSLVEIEFVSAPHVASVTLGTPAGYACSIDRFGNEATCADALAVNTAVEVLVALDAASDGAETQLVTCGGTATLLESGPGLARFSWTTPATTGPCVLSASTSRDGRTDALPVALLLF